MLVADRGFDKIIADFVSLLSTMQHRYYLQCSWGRRVEKVLEKKLF